MSKIEDLTRVVISYEICETNLWRVSYEMTTSLKFCLSYGPLKLDSAPSKWTIRKRIVDTVVVNDVTCTRQSVITRVVIRFL